MKLIRDATKRLRKLFRSKTSSTQDLIADLQICQKALLAAKGLIPSDLKGEKNAKRRAEYQSIIIDCLIESLNAEKAALANNKVRAMTAFKAMKAAKKKGHDKFQE